MNFQEKVSDLCNPKIRVEIITARAFLFGVITDYEEDYLDFKSDDGTNLIVPFTGISYIRQL